MSGGQSADVPESVRQQFSRWVAEHFGASATLVSLTRFPGHSGITYAFDVDTQSSLDRLVMRLAPAGVRRKHNTDVLRVAPLLSMLSAQSLPVPDVRFIGHDDSWFGAEYLVVERLPGATMPDVFVAAEPGSVPPAGVVKERYKAAIETLAALHSLPASRAPQEWEPPLTPQADLEQWVRLLRRSDDPAWVTHGEKIYRRLMETCPPRPEYVIAHGDFYSNNWLFEGTDLTGLLDWENTAVGPYQGDIGWLCAINNPSCWGDQRRQAMDWLPGPDAIMGWYEQASGRSLEHIEWYRANMDLRLACATAVNLKLHRSGRRVDPVWEVFGDAFRLLLDDADRQLDALKSLPT